MTTGNTPFRLRVTAAGRTMASVWLAAALASSPACATRALSGSGTPAAPPAVNAAPGGSGGTPGSDPAARTPAVRAGGDRQSEPAPLLGRLTEADIRAYGPWVPLFATPEVPASAEVETIRRHLERVSVIAIVATWCPDSRREVPRFLAITVASGMPASAITMVGVDRTKKDAEGLAERWGVTRVPTFVFLRDGLEIGRVVEHTPAGSTLEAEIARIVAAPGR